MAQLDVNKQNKLKGAMDRAKRIMQMESSGKLNEYASKARESINSALNEGGMPITPSVTQRTAPTSQVIANKITNNQVNSNIPSAIIESFKKNPIDDRALYTAMGSNTSPNDLDFLMSPQTTSQKVSMPIAEETKDPQSTLIQQPQMVQQTIDYPMIRTIVEEIVRKYASSLNKKIINENKESGNMLNTLMIGKTFKFLDQKGNIYECQMKRIGNVNDKKRSTVD
jgi:hypothetical protein